MREEKALRIAAEQRLKEEEATRVDVDKRFRVEETARITAEAGLQEEKAARQSRLTWEKIEGRMCITIADVNYEAQLEDLRHKIREGADLEINLGEGLVGRAVSIVHVHLS